MRRIPTILQMASAIAIGYVTAQSLPYNPTTILLSPKDPDLAYIFTQSTPSSSKDQLLYLNISTPIQASNLSLQSLTTDLPFLAGDNVAKSTAYILSISASGSIGVYAGSCTTPSSFWVFYPSKDSSTHNITNGTWRQMSTNPSYSISTANMPNANFLASSFSFSSLVDSNDTQRAVYTFGGMCPTSATSNVSTWQHSATYSNNMLKLSYSSQTSYDLSISSASNRPPVPEAGFTVTALKPTFSNSTGIMTQAQSYVLLGGHTSNAFINMSQVALFSLPQESWSFQNIDTATKQGNTELAVKSTSGSTITTPDSRSGHTAVLSSDGASIIVFGGWVGDVNTAAEPQLAVLRPGSGFGGTGNWAWELPSAKGTALAAGEGIYGHGAAMLPGDVMMVYGGTRVSAATSSKVASRANTATEALFLNTTSMTWLSSYTNPNYHAAAAGSTRGSSSSDAASRARKVGLGAGLGLGLSALIGAFLVYCWYSRRLKKRRMEAREKDLQQLGQNGADIYAGYGNRASISQDWWGGPQPDMAQRGPHTNLGNRTMGMGLGNNGGYAPVAYPQAGLYGDVDDSSLQPEPLRTNKTRGIPRKPVNPRNPRGHYQPTPNGSSNQSYSGFDLGTGHSGANSLGTAGVIHPIYEADEDPDTPKAPQYSTFKPEAGRAVNAPYPDPFRDPPPPLVAHSNQGHQGSRPGTGQDQYRPEPSANEREREITQWVADWAAADALMSSRAQSQTHSGRVSPSKESNSGRTESNLSERSAAAVSALTLSRTSSTRNNSLTAFFTGGGAGSWNPLRSGREHHHHGYGGGDVSPVSERSGNPPKSAGSGTSSFNTAPTSQSFNTLRAEAERLLPRPGRADEYISESSPSKSKAAAFSRRQQHGGWLGSLKRVFIGADVDDDDSGRSGSSRSSPTRGNRTRSPSLGHSPTRGVDSGGVRPVPRRAASATATMWRRKQGKDDWEDSAEERSNTLTLDGRYGAMSGLGDRGGASSRGGTSSGQGEEEEEWDIERAVERRVVQVMFTVPKEKLRVVNQDVLSDADEEEAEDPDEEKMLGRMEDDGAGREKEKSDAKEMVRDEVREVTDTEREREAASRPGSPGKVRGKKVQEILEKIEGMNSPVQ
jgi:hypothetical protein